MKSTVKKLSDTKIEIKVTLDKSDLADATKKALARLVKDVKVECFRKGKAPRELAEKLLNANDVSKETIDFAVRSTVPSAFSGTKSLCALTVFPFTCSSFPVSASMSVPFTSYFLPGVRPL